MTFELIDNICNKALYHLQFILSKYRRFFNEFSNMPIPIIFLNNEQNTNYLIREEQQYNIKKLARFTEDNIFRLNMNQQAAFEEIITAVKDKAFITFFVDDPDGTGKTFLYK